ncbi:nucleotidyltransferase [Brevibacillus agri]|uniref:Nucleotidyltransferase n=2 Tax=Brevibacillus agri TaxID=51101 RepID=A0A3M8B328_9BACL|nr:nucleotidyltransferase [Brevibacillus agri]QAV11807.1 nucleotidyltransferase [Brevibacillus agri]RNB57838.1 nucleotidyltransferase [Brevibacillus agri]
MERLLQHSKEREEPMKPYKDETDFFIELGRDFVEQLSLSGMVCAYAGGSVGRGEADAFSDLDLNVFMEGASEHRSENRQFRGQLIQLHVHSVPTIEDVRANPWAWRYLQEARLIADPTARFAGWFVQMQDYLESEEARQKMIGQVKAAIAAYERSGDEALAEGRFYSVALLEWAGWLEALQLIACVSHGKLSDRALYQLLRELGEWTALEQCFAETYQTKEALMDGLAVLAAYRAHLKTRRGQETFSLGAENDVLLKRKIDRLLRQGQYVEAGFLLFSEAVWLYSSTDEGNWWEEHWGELPPELGEALLELGFFQMDELGVSELRRAKAELIAKID